MLIRQVVVLVQHRALAVLCHMVACDSFEFMYWLEYSQPQFAEHVLF